MKKHNKKKSNGKIGRNIFGERCIVKEVELQKETAFEQYMEILKDIEAHGAKGIRLEYTVICSKDFEEEDIQVLNETVSKIMALRAHSRSAMFAEVDLGKLPSQKIA